MKKSGTPPLIPGGYLSPLSPIDAEVPDQIVSRLRVAVHLLDRATRDQFALLRAGIVAYGYDSTTREETAVLAERIARHVGVLRGLQKPARYQHSLGEDERATFRIPEPPAQGEPDLEMVYRAALYVLMDIVCGNNGAAMKALARVPETLADPTRRMMHIAVTDLLASSGAAPE